MYTKPTTGTKRKYNKKWSWKLYYNVSNKNDLSDTKIVYMVKNSNTNTHIHTDTQRRQTNMSCKLGMCTEMPCVMCMGCHHHTLCKRNEKSAYEGAVWTHLFQINYLWRDSGRALHWFTILLKYYFCYDWVLQSGVHSMVK